MVNKVSSHFAAKSFQFTMKLIRLTVVSDLGNLMMGTEGKKLTTLIRTHKFNIKIFCNFCLIDAKRLCRERTLICCETTCSKMILLPNDCQVLIRMSKILPGEDEQLESLVTLVAAPVSPWFASIPTLTASRVAGLQDFFTHYKPDASPNKTCGSQASVTSTSFSSTSDDLAKDLVPRLIAKPSGRRYTVGPFNTVTNGSKKFGHINNKVTVLLR